MIEFERKYVVESTLLMDLKVLGLRSSISIASLVSINANYKSPGSYSTRHVIERAYTSRKLVAEEIFAPMLSNILCTPDNNLLLTIRI